MHTAIITYLLNGTVQSTKAKLTTNRLTQSLIDELESKLTKEYKDKLDGNAFMTMMYGSDVKVEVINVMVLEEEEDE